ncbi:MAG: M1 family metallopeptidase [Phycisphaerae bacterium]|nr:M1 family metallopeptidase [Phycisphaerae bacterium]
MGCVQAPRGGEDVREAGATRPADFRRPGPRGAETIFSPLNLPTPSEVRLASGVPGPAYWQQQADYVIDATLDPEKRLLTGKARITYTNNSPHELDYIWVHLEQNLFRDDSLGALSTEPRTRFGNHGFDGGVTLRSLKTADGSELVYRVYDTLARVDLPRAIAAKGGRFVFDVEWGFPIPPYGADRMGVDDCEQGPVFELAQWFPAVAVYDDVHGWNTLPYLGQGEFYTNFGDYEVSLTVPRSHVVVATGVLQNPGDTLTPTQRERWAEAKRSATAVAIVKPEEVGTPESRPEGDGPLTWRFAAKDVRTFAWASSPAFIWDAAFLPGVGPEGPDGPEGTMCQSAYPKEALPLWGHKSTDDLRFSIEHYSRMWYRYPYPSAVNVNGRVGGMEYPMIVFCRERHDERGLWGVTTHEIGHNWFPMVVNTDERRHAWMDEGFNTFINYYAQLARYPDEKPNRRGDAGQYLGGATRGEQQPMETPADFIWRGRLGFLHYEKTAVALVLLREQVLGPERFDRAFRRYIAAWAFKSPRPADFFRCMEDAAGMDLAWFWRGWFLETGNLDQAVTGVTYADGGKAALIALRNLGELVMPVDLRLTFSDGSVASRRLPVEVWATTNQWTAPQETGGKRLVKVEIDPDGALPDVDASNNVWVGK